MSDTLASLLAQRDELTEQLPALDKKIDDARHAEKPIDEWTGRILRNMKRMATDEAYRKSIAQKLS